MIYLNLRKLGVRRAASVDPATAGQAPRKRTPYYTYIVPIFPVLMIMVFKWQIIPTFLVCIVLALVLTARDRTLQGSLNLFNKTFYDAFPDIATIAALWTICGMIIVAGQMPQVADALKPIFSPVLPHNTAQAAVFFGVLGGVLSIYRGPLVVVGTGAALLAILLSAGEIPVPFLYSLWLAPTVMQGSVDPTNSWTLWTIGYTKVSQGQFLQNRVAVRLADGRHLLGDLLRVAGPPLNMTERRTYRIGIDVGGTFTKAVLIDNATYEVVGRYSVLTTHSDPRGVAKGVVEVFRNVLERSAVAPADVVFLAHSTTQATNALLEGDVAAVGIIGMASRMEALLARSQSSIKEIELAPGRYLRPRHHFITRDGLDETTVRAALEEMRGAGVQVVVATSAFGVDDQSGEELVMREASRLGMAATGGHEISKLYGLTTRTRTAVINASILPKMIGTADMTEASVREAGIAAPLMIMRGDGGVMDVQEMRRRPVVTMLSGPAASVAGALMYLKVSDGIYFEVGGTSTNIGVIRNGRPTVKHARVGGHDTYVNSLDVRVLGIAGGSMVRVRGNEIADVGPRSAHIAGLPYAAFAAVEDIQSPELELFSPKPGDPDDYVAVRTVNGTRYAITNTCAANVLEYAKPGWHACGNREAARAALQPLAARLGVSVEEAARRILEKAATKVIPVVEGLIAEYGLDRDQSVLVGEGGGAAALIPFVAEQMGLRFQDFPGRRGDLVDRRGLGHGARDHRAGDPQPDTGRPATHQARGLRSGGAAGRGGRECGSDHRSRSTDTACPGHGGGRLGNACAGSAEGSDRGRGARHRSQLDGVVRGRRKLAAATDQVRVYQGEVVERKWRFFTSRRRPVRAVDREGVIRVQRSDGVVLGATAATGVAQLRRCWEEVTIYNGDSVITPDVFVIAGRRVVDLSGITALDQATTIGRSELEGLPDEAAIAIIGVQGARGV